MSNFVPVRMLSILMDIFYLYLQMTSLGSRSLHETKKLGHRSLLFRVRTAQLPSAKVDITFKDGKGMKGKYSFVNCRESWRVQIGTLGFYARGRGVGSGKAAC